MIKAIKHFMKDTFEFYLKLYENNYRYCSR